MNDFNQKSCCCTALQEEGCSASQTHWVVSQMQYQKKRNPNPRPNPDLLEYYIYIEYCYNTLGLK